MGKLLNFKRILIYAVVVASLSVFTGVCGAAAVYTWYFDDSGVLGWGQNG